MQTMTRESWSDERLDDLNGRVSDGFRQVDERFDRLERTIDRKEARDDERFDRLDSRIDGIQRTMVQGVIALCGVFAAGFGVLGTLIATQL